MQSRLSKSSLGAWLICVLGAIYYCYEYFLRIIPSVITPELMRTYDLTGAQVGNLSAFYYHAYVPMQIIVGLLMDRFGPRRLLTLACLCCALGTYLFVGGYGLSVAQAGRFLVGFGSAFAFVGALKLATIWLPPNRFAFISGLITCLGMIGAMAGDILLRFFVDGLGWQMAISIAAVTGIVLSAFLWMIVRDTNPHQMFSHSKHIYFHDLLRGLLKAMKNPQIWMNGILGLLLYVSLVAFAELWGIPYLEEAHGLSATSAANANSMVFLGWAIGAPCWGWFSDYIGLRRLPVLCCSIGALIVVCILLYIPELSERAIFVLLLGFGLLSSVQVVVFAICRELSSAKIAGTAIALTNMLIMLGGNIFQPVIGRLLDLNWQGTFLNGARVYSVSAYQLALSVIPFSLLVAIILVLFIRETHASIDE